MIFFSIKFSRAQVLQILALARHCSPRPHEGPHFQNRPEDQECETLGVGPDDVKTLRRKNESLCRIDRLRIAKIVERDFVVYHPSAVGGREQSQNEEKAATHKFTLGPPDDPREE